MLDQRQKLARDAVSACCQRLCKALSGTNYQRLTTVFVESVIGIFDRAFFPLRERHQNHKKRATPQKRENAKPGGRTFRLLCFFFVARIVA